MTLISRDHLPGRLNAKNFVLDGPWMLKALVWMLFDPKTSKSKILTCRGHLAGRLDAKSFDVDGPWMLKDLIWIFFDSRKIQIEDANMQGPSVGSAGC